MTQNPKSVPVTRHFVKDAPHRLRQTIEQQAKLIAKMQEELRHREDALRVVVFQTSKEEELGTIDDVQGMTEHNTVDDLAAVLVECGRVARATLDGNYEWGEKYNGSPALTI